MTAVEITVNLDFRCSCESKNNGEKLLPRSLVMKDYVHPDDQTQPTSFFVARLCSVSRVLRFLPVKFSK